MFVDEEVPEFMSQCETGARRIWGANPTQVHEDVKTTLAKFQEPVKEFAVAVETVGDLLVVENGQGVNLFRAARVFRRNPLAEIHDLTASF
jgi:hypothetical protein